MRTIPRYCVFALVVMLMLGIPASLGAQVSVGVTVAFAPPDLPVYEQPVCPQEGYIWTPGYWAWDEDYGDYYWVPGTWVPAPEVGFLWTPGYWAWGGSGFVFYEGYWSYQVVGFYGGINYGYGYFGRGFEGGHWDNGRFFYNRSVSNVDVTIIHNVYEAPVNIRNAPRTSFNGGNGGIDARPTPQEESAAHARHLPPAAVQTQHFQAARSNPQLRASVNHGKPPIAATPKPAAFNQRGVVSASEAGAIHGGPSNAGRGNAQAGNNNPSRTTAVHPNELPPVERPSPPNTGNPKQDQKYQKQQEKMYAQQEKERQKLQQQQEKEHQQLAKQNADEARKQQVEQQHQQQTQQLQQKHSQQQQQLQQKQQPAKQSPQKEKH
jgi:YXWGXW repeat-containing protein